MARSTEYDKARSVVRAAERLDEINREVAEILRAFPELRPFIQARVLRRERSPFAGLRAAGTWPRQFH